MIIQCPNCDKKFELDSNLIPDSGRDLQCGSCNHIWFFKKDLYKNQKKIEEPEKINLTEKTDISKSPKTQKSDNSDNFENEIYVDKEKPLKKVNDNKIIKKSTYNLSFGHILSYLVVIIVSFIGLIIILDTFKSPLSNIFPNLELMLFNLFETLEDIFLFLKNLLI